MITLVELVSYLQTELVQTGSVDPQRISIRGVASIQSAAPGELSFLNGSQFEPYAAGCRASALISSKVPPGFQGPVLLHSNPHFAFAKASHLFHKPQHGRSGVDPRALVEEGVHLGENVTIGAGTFLGEGAHIGDGAVIYPQVYIGPGAQIGAGSILYPQVVVYDRCIIGERCIVHAGSIIGADGFGFAVHQQEICKIPQLGIVRIGNDVELGAQVTIDRAAHFETIIGDGCKFDDKVHIGHNVEVGANCLFAAYSGVAGSTKIGSWVVMGGHTGIAGHLEIASGTQIGAKSGVIDHIRERGTFVGFPAEPAAQWKRSLAYTKRLREAFSTIRQLEQRLATLEQQLVSSKSATDNRSTILT